MTISHRNAYPLVSWSLLTIGQRIAWHRRRNGMSQQDLASACDMEQSCINRIERLGNDNLRVFTVRRIANALGVCCGELLD